MAPLPRHDHNEGPPTPGEYILLLIILVAVGISYIVWWRHRGGQTSFALENLSSLRRGVRLSLEDDGPLAESFLTNNASSDSLPLHINDLPEFPAHVADEAAALVQGPAVSAEGGAAFTESGSRQVTHPADSADPLGASRTPSPSAGAAAPTGGKPAVLPRFARRSAKSRAPVELSDSDSEGEGNPNRVFALDDDDE